MDPELTQSDLLKIMNAQYQPTPKELRFMAKQLFEFRSPEIHSIQSIPDGVMLSVGRA